jgi:type II secretory pathway pseudopilin PulG
MPPGYSLVELTFAVGVITTLAGVAAPQFLAGLDDYRTAGAVRYLTTRIQRARMEAVARSANVALQITQTAAGFTFASYVDGNGDGVRTKDIRSSVDRPLGPPERLSDNFSGVDFGVLPGLPPVDSGSTAPGADPIKLGTSNLLSFSAIGTSSTGSLYVRGRGNAQYVVRVMGETGRVHVLKFDARTRQWRTQ